jgi:hypothetical protein
VAQREKGNPDWKLKCAAEVRIISTSCGSVPQRVSELLHELVVSEGSRLSFRFIFTIWRTITCAGASDKADRCHPSVRNFLVIAM